ncbi:MAG: peptide chain release factor 2 [Gemmatimonadetes bacterium]|nr:peptide chain release factor 2 [Gemmatimonadota bacterium]MYC73526.1 peptide chain release factor 2 [Gemmatimonadota bacterium]
MTMATIEEQLTSGRQQLERLRGIFDISGKKEELAALEKRMAAADFWNDRRQAESVGKAVRILKDTIADWETLDSQLEDLAQLRQMAAEEGDAEALAEVEAEVESAMQGIGELEFRTMLNDEADPKNAILVIHSGAGGTDAAEWASMLMRLYTRWTERHGMECTVVDLQQAEEAGIKGATIEVRGDYAYGYLKAEAGVHRLVRLSPFDTSRRRHTSFASVFVYPEVEDDIEVDINDEDVKVETYRSGGAGGQHVNKTASAVRLTHLPTGIVVQCQNERSQFKNKATAFKVLKARLYQHLKDEQKQKQLAVESTKKSIDFGSQIRSYVLHPYTIVKDHRTACETANVQAVMDGDIDRFIRAYLTEGQT